MLEEEWSGWRLSFCCATQECRRRTTPPSVRFFNRRVYWGALVVLVTALSQGLTGGSRARLREAFGLSTRTLRRWQRWWREVFPVADFWRGAVGRFIPSVTVEQLPASLLERFGAWDRCETLIAVLGFLAPLSLASRAGSLKGGHDPQTMRLPLR